MSETKSNNKLTGAVAILLILVSSFTFIFLLTKPKATKGNKSIVIEIVPIDSAAYEKKFSTKAEFLAEVLAENKLIPDSDLAMGFVTTIDGITADSALEQWWMMTVNGEFADYGINDLVVEDGAHYEFILSEGWDW